MNPWRGIRRLLWIALFGSASIGLLIMSTKGLSGESILISDALIQLGAFFIFATLLWIDRPKKEQS